MKSLYNSNQFCKNKLYLSYSSTSSYKIVCIFEFISIMDDTHLVISPIYEILTTNNNNNKFNDNPSTFIVDLSPNYQDPISERVFDMYTGEYFELTKDEVNAILIESI